MVHRDARIALYPEVEAGGFTRVDGTIEFYVRVNALLMELGMDVTVLDFGAGRGENLGDAVPFRRNLRMLRGKASRVIGVDVEDTVLENPWLDEAHVIREGQPLPLQDQTIDLVISDWVFEHLADPAWAASELDRIMRPGAWLCVRTPNRSGYVALGARIIPERLHASLLERLQPTKRPEDHFPTFYRLNRPSAFERWFPPSDYTHVIYADDSEPAYVGRSLAAARLNRLVFRLTPPKYRSILYAFVRKKQQAAAVP